MTACPACGKEVAGDFPFCPYCTAPLTGESREQRKTVTVLFCDVTGSTALGESTDPEALRALLARYFERMKGIFESHGGTVEKFIGDAVMAVFGVPVAHEDDALKACRAAVEMRDALPELGVQARIGVNTGEVVTGTAERLATGDALNVAARLEQAAVPGEVLTGEATHALVHDAVTAEPVEPLTLKGKSEPVPAYRLVSVLDAPERSHVSRFVGREAELAQIVEAWERLRAQARCELVTVVGDAGVGKSRLVTEALAVVDARVVRGRCLPYGEGITYWPVVEVVKQLAVLPSDPVAAAAIRSLLGESEVGTSGDEIAWAFRKLLEEQAPSNWSVLRIVNTLSGVLDMARKHGYIRFNPVHDVERVPARSNREPVILTLAEVWSLIEHAPDPHTACLILVAAFTGARQSEIFALRWPSVELAEGHEMLTIREEYYRGELVGATKTAAGMRSVPIVAHVAEALRAQ